MQANQIPMRKKGGVVAELFQQFMALPHLPWEVIVPALPHAVQAARMTARRVHHGAIPAVRKSGRAFGRAARWLGEGMASSSPAAVKYAAFVGALRKWASGVDTIRFVNPNSVEGDVVRVVVEVAQGDIELRRGLMGRQHLPDGQGMLFDFPSVERRSFWMRNVPIPLDMVFVKVDGTVSNVVDSAEPNSDTPHLSTEPVRFVVELPGGFCGRHGIEAGWRMVRGG